MAKVDLKKVNKIYGAGEAAVHAVRDLDLEIRDGEFLALVGPSGCGKTSTLRMIVGLEEISSGDILFDGVRVNDATPQMRNVAMAFETYALYPNFTVEENLAFPLEARGVSEADRRKKARKIAEMLQIQSILDQKPGELSGGQQQRISLGRALIRDPAVFILDEVMSHVDAHLKFQMLIELKTIHRELGKTMIYVTHDQVEALALADRVAVMSDAKLQQVGDRNTLYRQPANVFVADFIGEPPTNFFTVTPRNIGNQVRLAHTQSSLKFRLPASVAGQLKSHGGDSFIVGLRPQNLHVGGTGPRVLEAQVQINEYLGEQSILTLEAGISRFQALVPPQTNAQPGDMIKLGYASEDIMVFDPKTEVLIA
ncbi:MAG: ABC transporter ATP-binding protein [Alphaproteobacteria bacterium]